MFAHERSLVTKYKNRPFVLLGVNADFTPEAFQQCQEKAHLNWRSWYDGVSGPIAEEWKVAQLPTLFLLDHKGMIRWQHISVPDNEHLDKLIEQLISEAESDGKKHAALSKR